MTASVGDRIEVLFNTGTSKGYDLYAGEIVSHSLGKVHRIVAPTLTPPTHSREPSDTSIQLSVQVYRVHFDDGTSGELVVEELILKGPDRLPLRHRQRLCHRPAHHQPRSGLGFASERSERPGGVGSVLAAVSAALPHPY